MNALEYHEWCEREFPVGSRVRVRGTMVTFSQRGTFPYEYVGTVVGHPYEWEEGGDAESGQIGYVTRTGVQVEVEGVARDECPSVPGTLDYQYELTVLSPADDEPGWRVGREEMLAEDEEVKRAAERYREYEEDEDRCPKCGEKSLKHGVVCTLGYPGHPGAEFSGYEECGNCDYKDLA